MITDITLPSAQQVIAQIHSDNPASEEIINLAVVNLTNVTELVDHVSGKNTAVTMTAKLNVGHKGSSVFRYNRNPLSAFIDVFNLGDPIDLLVEEGDNAADIITRFNTRFGSNLQIGEDISSFTVPELDYDGKIVTIQTLPTSYAWTGDLSFTVMMESFPLSNFIVNTDVGSLTLTDDINISDGVTTSDLSGFDYGVAGVPSVTVASLYTYGLDLTPYYSTLQPLTQGTVLSTAQGTSLDTALTYADLDGAWRTEWKSTTTATGLNLIFNLQGATVIYNGLNNVPSKPTNPAFKYVLELQLKANQTAPLGNLYLHYNQPIDPTNVIDPNV